MPDGMQERLAATVSAVQALATELGGGALPGSCAGRDLGPPGDVDHRWERDRTVHCDQYARFELPYVREDGERGMLTACAIDDWAATWPVFAAAAPHAEEGWL